MALVGAQHVDRAVEVDVAVVALANALDRESEDGRIEPLSTEAWEYAVG